MCLLQRVVVQQASAAWALVMLHVAVEEGIQPVSELPVLRGAELSAGLERVREIPLAVVPRPDPSLLRVGQAGEL
jgi:hypothetical protein